MELIMDAGNLSKKEAEIIEVSIYIKKYDV